MTRFQLPQFIETETKLVGPFTLRQFLWIAGGAAILFLLFMTIGGLWALIIGIPIAGVFVALAFVRVGDVPLINYVAYAFSYLLNPKRYLYTKEEETSVQPPSKPEDQ